MHTHSLYIQDIKPKTIKGGR